MRRLLFAVFLLTPFLFAPPVSAYYTNMPASVVIGQPDFVSNSINQGGSAGAGAFKYVDIISSDGRRIFVAD